MYVQFASGDSLEKDCSFANLFVICMSLAPEALFIIQDTWNFGANQLIQFELVQLAVSHY